MQGWIQTAVVIFWCWKNILLRAIFERASSHSFSLYITNLHCFKHLLFKHFKHRRKGRRDGKMLERNPIFSCFFVIPTQEESDYFLWIASCDSSFVRKTNWMLFIFIFSYFFVIAKRCEARSKAISYRLLLCHQQIATLHCVTLAMTGCRVKLMLVGCWEI